MKNGIRSVVLSFLVLFGSFLAGGCSSTPYPETKDELFQALDAGIDKWKDYYDNAEFARQDRLKKRLNGLARENRYQILQAISSKDHSHRMIAAKSLPFLRLDRQVLNKINSALTDTDRRVRENAAFSVGIIRPDWDQYKHILGRIKENVLNMTRSEDVNEQKMGYFGVFGLVSPRNAHGMMDVLIKGLKSDSVAIRNQSVRALQVIQAENTVEPLLKNTLHDPSELVRLNTIIALYSINDKRAVPGLIDLLLKGNQENPEIVRMAVELLRRLTGMRELKTPEEWINWYQKERASNQQPAGNTPDSSEGKNSSDSENSSGSSEKDSGSETKDSGSDKNENQPAKSKQGN